MASRTTSINVDQAGGTTATLIAAVTGYRVQVVSYNLAVSGEAVTLKSTLQDITANTVRATLVGNATASAIYNVCGTPESPAFETAISEGVELVTGTAAVVQGQMTYRYVMA